jgi:hypothetical protein
MAYEPTLTARTDMLPVPRVEFVFDDLPATAYTATVVREVDGQVSRVRGNIGVFASGGFAGVDTEVPFGVDVQYRAEMFEVDGGTLGFTDPATVNVGFAGTVIHNPLDPFRSVVVRLLNGSVPSISREDDGELVQPSGSDLPIWVGFGRSGLRGVPLNVLTESAADEASLVSVFGTYGDRQLPIVCFRSSLSLGLPQPFFGLVRSPRRERVDAARGGSLVSWTLLADEVRSPAEALSAGILTYLDMESSYETYDDIEAAYLTYLDAESDFTLAGVS